MKGRAAAGLLVLLLLALARPLENRLRAGSPLPPSANRLGVGRLMGGVLTGAFRPLLLNYLWIRSDVLYGQGRYDELHILYRTMVSLYPNNERAREFLGWLLAYNLKQEAPTVELKWRWAAEGLDILVGVAGRRPLADWFLKQCGQNAHELMRYAGPEWVEEKEVRARARAWGKRHFGLSLDRFELGLFALEGAPGFYDYRTRTDLYTAQVLDDWMREGRSKRLDEAVAANRRLAGPDGFADNPPLAVLYARRARYLRELDQGKVTEELTSTGSYWIAAAYWGLGAHRRDAELLRAGLRALDSVEGHPFREERALLAQWIEFVEGGGKGPRPALPFD